MEQWNKLDQNNCDSKSLSFFKKTLLKFIRRTNFKCPNPKRAKLLASNIALKIHLTQCVAVAKVLKIRLISFFTVLIIQMND